MVIKHKNGAYWTGTGWGSNREAMRYHGVASLPTHITGMDGFTDLDLCFTGEARPPATYSASNSSMYEAYATRAE